MTSSGASGSAARYATVRNGDTFATVAARNGVSEARVAALNPGVDPSALVVGQGLRVG
jgi:LysM repeat protein